MSAGNDIAVRSALLRYYSSEFLYHAGYILTLSLVFFSGLGLYFQFVDKAIVALFADKFLRSFIKSLIVSFSVSSFVVFGTYLVLRTIWWGYLANAIVHLSQEFGEEDFQSLHRRCGKYAFRHRSRVVGIVRRGLGLQVILLWLFTWFILFLFVFGLIERI